MTYLDTFDWRLYRKGSRLATAIEGADRSLLWRPPNEEAFCRLPVGDVPEFVWDLPDGAIRSQIDSLVDVRRLLPVAELSLRGTSWNLVDRRHKILVTLVLESGTATDPVDRRTTHRLPVALRVIPIKGYVSEFRKLQAAIEGPGRSVDRACPLELALELFDRHPQVEAAKPVLRLGPDQRSDEAMKTVLRCQLPAMRRNLDGLRRNLDTEFLHDFRVAVRRTRSALAQVPGVFPRSVTERYRRGFSWLGKATGPVRDLDVYLLSLPAYSAALPEDLRPGLAAIERLLQRQHRVEHRRLVASLATSRYDRLMAGWEEFLNKDVPRASSLPNATRPIGELAGERIRRSHRRVLKKGRAIKNGSPPAKLHRLRIECKKLRYLLEFFSSLYPEREVRRLVRALKKLQDNLGDYNDYVVQQQWLRSMLDRLAQNGPVPDLTRSAVQEILRQLEDRRRSTREAFHSRFELFADRSVSAVFQRLFGEARP
jgi:CHAD domain-containing protein